MNVTFLSSTSTFSGLMYNMKKVDAGVAQLIHVQNFDALKYLGKMEMKDYLDYIKAWSDKNTRTKNPQFHVAISVKGRAKGSEELLKISRDWLDRMGYGTVPALFYFHGDTENNHIHIVASRIDKDGRKINDSNEIRRGLRLIRELNGVDLKTRAKEDFYKLEHYKVETKAQYGTLWKTLGYRVKMTAGQLHVFKEGVPVLSITDDIVNRQLRAKEALISERAREIREIFSKYKDGLRIEDFSLLLKDRYNLELAFYGRKEAPYGYAIIDHDRKEVYKGGDIYPVKDLINDKKLLSDDEQVKRVNLFARHMLEQGRITSREMGQYVKKMGLNLYQGEISYKKLRLGAIDEDLQERLRYNDRLEKASAVPVYSEEGAEVTAKYYRVRDEDLELKENVEYAERDLLAIYRELMGKEQAENLEGERRIVLVNHNNSQYLLDLDHGQVQQIPVSPVYQSTRGSSEGDTSIIDGEELSAILGIDIYDNIWSSSTDNSLKKRRR